MSVSHHNDDPWARETTACGLAADEVISSLQKSIRRNDLHNAVLCAHDLSATSAELDEFLWDRLHVIAVEDVGFGEPGSIAEVGALCTARLRFPWSSHDRLLFTIHAVRLLCAAQKDRSNDELANVVRDELRSGQRPDIPDHALDMHTRRGQELGRGLEHFLSEGAKIAPEYAGRDRQWRDQLLKRLGLPADPQ